MAMTEMRLLVTGVDAQGRSCVVEETRFDPASPYERQLLLELDAHWPSRPPGRGEWKDLAVLPGGLRWQVSRWAPNNEWGMHYTDTIDLELVVQGSVEVLLDDGDHRLAKPANLVESEHRFVFRPDIDQAQHGIDVVRNVHCRNDPLDAWMPLRCTRIDPQDPCMVVRTADHAEVEKPRKPPVGVERRNASDVAGGVGALSRLTDFLEIAMTFVGEITFTYFHHTAPRSAVSRRALLVETDKTALMIGS